MTKLFSNKLKYCVIIHFIYLQNSFSDFSFSRTKVSFVPLRNTAVNYNISYKYLDDFAESIFTSSMSQESPEPVWLKPAKCSFRWKQEMRKYWRLCSSSSVKRLCLNISLSKALYLNESSRYALNKTFLGTRGTFLYAMDTEYHYLPLRQSSKKHSKLQICSKPSCTQSLDWNRDLSNAPWGVPSKKPHLWRASTPHRPCSLQADRW